MTFGSGGKEVKIPTLSQETGQGWGTPLVKFLERNRKDGFQFGNDVHSSLTRPSETSYCLFMPRGLKRFQEAKCLHFITFSCHHREPLLGTAQARDVFERTLEQVRRWYDFYVCGYVVMPEHVHLLISEPERGRLSLALQMLKQNVARELRLPEGSPFWQPRYYDFNVWSKAKLVEKLRYTHRNPVRRGLVKRPEDWKWSSFLHYATGVEGVVEIESQWTARRRERMGIAPTVRENQNQKSKSNSPPCLTKRR